MSITFSVGDFQESCVLPSLNVSNTNGLTLLDALGLPIEAWGECQPSAIIAACDQVMADTDEGVPTATGPGMLGDAVVAVMVDCGRRSGYLQDRARALLDVAVAAQRLGRDVVWA